MATKGHRITTSQSPKKANQLKWSIAVVTIKKPAKLSRKDVNKLREEFTLEPETRLAMLEAFCFGIAASGSFSSFLDMENSGPYPKAFADRGLVSIAVTGFGPGSKQGNIVVGRLS